MVSSHILSRFPGGRAVEYKEIARKMGEVGIVSKKFAQDKLVKMAGMRNLLVHAYSDLEPDQLYETVQNHLEDVERFLKYVKVVVKNPGKFRLSLG